MMVSASGCKKKQDASPTTAPAPQAAAPAQAPLPAGSPRDIAANPAVLLDKSVAGSAMELHGAKIGDDKLPAGASSQPDPSGWVGFKGKENVFRLENDKVAAMQFSDPAALGRLGITSEQDLFAKLGQPEQTIEASADAPEAMYIYKSRGLTIIWNRTAKRIAAVNIGS
jgi:hypothetical protein